MQAKNVFTLLAIILITGFIVFAVISIVKQVSPPAPEKTIEIRFQPQSP